MKVETGTDIIIGHNRWRVKTAGAGKPVARRWRALTRQHLRCFKARAGGVVELLLGSDDEEWSGTNVHNWA